jgi:16S rRNA (guanine527-N7)-methyltransferase
MNASRVANASTAAGLCASAGLLGVPLQPAQAARLLRLLDELEQWNRAYNLTRIATRAAMITHHLLDSLAASGDLAGTRIADLGTGAGFPGLPLALVHPEREFTLIDATAKKIRFVAHAARTLGLHNVHPLHARAESLRPEPPFDTIVARAVASLAELAVLAAPLSGPGTLLLAYKGARPDAEIGALPAGWTLVGVRALRIPGLEAERCLVTLRAGAAAWAGAARGARPEG